MKAKDLWEKPYKQTVVIRKSGGHTYVRRTGGPGNYKYEYADEGGGRNSGGSHLDAIKHHLTEAERHSASQSHHDSDGDSGMAHHHEKISEDHYNRAMELVGRHKVSDDDLDELRNDASEAAYEHGPAKTGSGYTEHASEKTNSKLNNKESDSRYKEYLKRPYGPKQKPKPGQWRDS